MGEVWRSLSSGILGFYMGLMRKEIGGNLSETGKEYGGQLSMRMFQ